MDTTHVHWDAFDLADRLRRSLRLSGVSPQQMADFLEVHRNTISNWMSGRVEPPAMAVKLWAQRVGAPETWLRNGEAPQPVEAEALRGLPRLDLNQRPSDYVHPQVKARAYGRYLRLVGSEVAA